MISRNICIASLIALGPATLPVSADVSEVQFVITYDGAITDSANPSAGTLHKFTVAVDNISNSRNIGALHIDFTGSGIYQVQNESSGSPIETIFSDSLPAGPNRLVDTHLLVDAADVIIVPSVPQGESLVAGPVAGDGAFHGFGSSFTTGAMGLLPAVRGNTVTLAQLVIAPGSSVTLSGLSAVEGDTDPGGINPESPQFVMQFQVIPEPNLAAIALIGVGVMASRRRHTGRSLN